VRVRNFKWRYVIRGDGGSISVNGTSCSPRVRPWPVHRPSLLSNDTYTCPSFTPPLLTHTRRKSNTLTIRQEPSRWASSLRASCVLASRSMETSSQHPPDPQPIPLSPTASPSGRWAWLSEGVETPSSNSTQTAGPSQNTMAARRTATTIFRHVCDLGPPGSA